MKAKFILTLEGKHLHMEVSGKVIDIAALIYEAGSSNRNVKRSILMAAAATLVQMGYQEAAIGLRKIIDMEL